MSAHDEIAHASAPIEDTKVDRNLEGAAQQSAVDIAENFMSEYTSVFEELAK